MVKRKFDKTKNRGNKVKKKKPKEKKVNTVTSLHESASEATEFFRLVQKHPISCSDCTAFLHSHRKAALLEAQVFSDQELDFMLCLNSKSPGKHAIDCTVLLKIANKLMALPNLDNYVSEMASLLQWSIVGDDEERTAQNLLSDCSKLAMSLLQKIGKPVCTRKKLSTRLMSMALKRVSANYRWIVALASNKWTSEMVTRNLATWYSAAEDTVKEPFRRLVLPYFCDFSANGKRGTATTVMRRLVETWIIQFRSDRNDIFANVKRNLTKNPAGNYARIRHWHDWFATGVVTEDLLKRVNGRFNFLCEHDFKLFLEICYCANDVQLLQKFVLPPFRKRLLKYIKTPGPSRLVSFILQPTTWDDYYFPNLHNQETRRSILKLLHQNLTRCFLPFVTKNATVMLSKQWKVALVSKILRNSTGDGEVVKATMLAVARDIMQNHLPLLPTSNVYHLLAENVDADAFLYAVNAKDKNHVYFSACLLDVLGGEGWKKFLANESSFEILNQLFHTEIPAVLERLENSRPLLEEILLQANTSHKENLLYLLNDKYGEHWNRLV